MPGRLEMMRLTEQILHDPKCIDAVDFSISNNLPATNDYGDVLCPTNHALNCLMILCKKAIRSWQTKTIKNVLMYGLMRGHL